MAAAATKLINLSELLNLFVFFAANDFFNLVCRGKDQIRKRAIFRMLSEASDVMPILIMPLPISSRDLKSPVA